MDIDEQRDSRPDGGGVQHGDTTRLLAEKAAAIHELARRTRELARRTIENIVRIGQYLVEARADVGYGAWLTWIEVEFNWSDQTARRFIHLHELSRNGKINTVLNLDLPLGVLYQLAAPKAVAARQEIAERIEAGEPISQETVIEAIKGHGKSPIESYPAAESGRRACSSPEIGKIENDDAASAETRKAAYAATEAAGGAVEHDSDSHDRHNVADRHDHGEDRGYPATAEVDPVTATEHSSRILNEFFEEASGADIFEHIPAARRAEVVASFPVKTVIEVFGEQLRAELPTNPLIKLRELDNATAAQTLYGAFGKDRFEAIVRKVHDLHSPKAGKPGKSGKPFNKTLNLTVSGNSAGKRDPRDSRGPVHRNGQYRGDL